MDSSVFMGGTPVFTLTQYREALAVPSLKDARDDLREAARRNRVRSLGRDLYCGIPKGEDAATYQPDPVHVILTYCPDAVFCGTAALRLNGLPSVENRVLSVYTKRVIPELDLDGRVLEFVTYPRTLETWGNVELGVTHGTHNGIPVRFVGPERSLVDGIWRPDRSGGLANVLTAIDSAKSLDGAVLHEVLRAFGDKRYYAFVGWYIESSLDRFPNLEELLPLIRRVIPKATVPLYREEKKNFEAPEWNLLIPKSVQAWKKKRA